jgi:inward rectifier potassium channel
MHRHSRQNFERSGAPAIKVGVPSRLSDQYYFTMELGWPAFVGLIAIIYIIVNVAFGAVYACLPGAIAHVRPYSLLDGFFFSVDTLGTVGYGSMAPRSPLGHFIAAFEILIGLFFSATVTGLIFSRFARPRSSMLFSNVAVIGRYDGRPALMVRVASTRSRPLADASAQMNWLERSDAPDGRIVRRLIDLPLVRSQNPIFGLTWTLVHLLGENDDVLTAIATHEQFTLNVSVSGFDTFLASQAIADHSYAKADIRRDHDFCDVLSEVGGVLRFDLTRFHDTQACRL